MSDVEKKMEEALAKLKIVDMQSYAIANLQATEIEEYLQLHDECSVMTIGLGDRTFTLDITHTDVLNEIYCMLENLQNLG